jgi:hypothetical protein
MPTYRLPGRHASQTLGPVRASHSWSSPACSSGCSWGNAWPAWSRTASVAPRVVVEQVGSPEVPDGRVLQAGEYWLSVCHKDGNATGAYSVGVTTRG